MKSLNEALSMTTKKDTDLTEAQVAELQSSFAGLYKKLFGKTANLYEVKVNQSSCILYKNTLTMVNRNLVEHSAKISELHFESAVDSEGLELRLKNLIRCINGLNKSIKKKEVASSC